MRLLHEVQECATMHGRSEKYMEGCLSAGMRIWSELSHMITVHQFRSEAEEIWFFKHIKPKFKGLVESYSLMHSAQVLASGEKDLMVYWENEKELTLGFLKKHKVFYHYYKTGETRKDSEYFLRKNIPRQAYHTAVHAAFSTPQSTLLANLLSREKYLGYIEQKLEELLSAN